MERETINELLGNHFIGMNELIPFFKVILSLLTSLFATSICGGAILRGAATLNALLDKVNAIKSVER